MKNTIKVLSGLLMLLYCSCSVEQHPDATWVQTICTVTELKVGRASNTWVEFYSDPSKRVEVRTAVNLYGLQIGDKFVIQYNPASPEENFIINQDRIVFSQEDSLLFGVPEYAAGKVTRVSTAEYSLFDDTENRYSVHFKYSVDGVEYQRTQYLPLGISEDYREKIRRAQCSVIYLPGRPRRAIYVL